MEGELDNTHPGKVTGWMRFAGMADIDVGGEQSRQFAGEIRLLKKVLGYPRPIKGIEDEMARRERIVRKLRRLAIEARGLTASLPDLPPAHWFDGTMHDTRVQVDFGRHDLADLLTFIADVGVGYDD